MDPNTPQLPPQQTALSPESPQNNQPPQKKKKTLIITLVILGVVLLVALVLALIFSPKNKNEPVANTSDTSVYYDRPGYERKDLSESVGDPLALTLTPATTAQKLASGVVIIPGCSVLTPTNLSDQGLKLYPNDFGFPVQQNYISSTGKAPFVADANNMPLTSETIACHYATEASEGVTITVNQAFTVREAVVSRWMTGLGGTSEGTKNGYTVLKKDDGETTRYVLSKGTDTIEVQFTNIAADKQDMLVEKAASNLAALATDPKGTSTASYKSPVFTETYAQACDLADNDDMKALSGNDASALVREFIPTSIGVADFSKVSDYKTKTNFIRSQCIRTANDPQYKTLIGTNNHTLQTTTTTYENEDAAKNGLLHYAVGTDTAKTPLESIGHEAYAYVSKEEKQNTIAFRQGRVVVEMVYDFAQQKEDPAVADLATYSEKLTPVGMKFAEKIKAL